MKKIPAVLASRPGPRRFIDYENEVLQKLTRYYTISIISGLLLALVQLVFLVYFTVLIFRTPRTP